MPTRLTWPACAEPRITLRSIQLRLLVGAIHAPCRPLFRSSSTRDGSALNPTREICYGRFRPHSKERFARRAEDLAIQRLFAFRPVRLTARFDRRSTLRFEVIAPATHSRVAKTRMNTRFSPAHDGPKRAVTLLLTRVPFL
jgi:hypothetical protein